MDGHVEFSKHPNPSNSLMNVLSAYLCAGARFYRLTRQSP